MKKLSPAAIAILWCIGNHQQDLLEALQIHGYAKLAPLMKVLMELK